MFYAGFPLRGLRWAVLLRGTGIRVTTRDSTEIIFLSWLVNCVVPAKLGDVYRAYLLKINTAASLSRTFGTVFIERVMDLVAIAVLGIAAGFWSFRDGLPPAIQLIFAIGLVVVAGLGDRLVHAAQLRPPDPRRAAVPAHGPRALRPVRGGRVRGDRASGSFPFLGFLTGTIWMTEAVPTVPRHPGVRLPGRPARASRGRSSWR